MNTLVHASEAHLADCRYRHLSKKTIAHYQEYEQSFIEWLAHGNKSMGTLSLNRDNVRAFSEYIRTRHGGKRNGEWAARAAVSTLKIWSRYLVDEDLLEADYLATLPLPKTTKIARQAYEPWEIQALRGAMADSSTATRDVAILSLLLDTGIRVSELCNLTIRDVDLIGRRLMVHGKGRLERVLPFGNSTSRDGGSTVRRLRAYFESRWVNPRLVGEDRERFFMSVHGHPLTDVGVRAIFSKAAHKAGLRHQEVHSCRHTFATTYLIRNPGDIEGLRYLMGHLSNDMYRVYAGQAGQRIAEIAGRESVADVLMNQEADGQGVSRGHLHALSPGVGPAWVKDDPTASPRRQGKEEVGRAGQRPHRGRHFTH